MKLTFYGVRGSYPIARRDQIRYGGNTTCLHFQSDSGQDLILDGGSGIRVLGNHLMAREFGQGRGRAYILVGHTHWDHIMGYPFFSPFYHQGNRFTVVSAGQANAHIRDILSGQQLDINFPVSFENWKAELDYRSIKPGETFTLGDFKVETVQLNHPGITVGYRLEADGRAATVFTDTARISKTRLGDGMGGPQPDPAYSAEFTARLVHCARQSDVLVHDTHFFEHEMVSRYDWGHSTVEDALHLAHQAGVERLILFHHAPSHSDVQVDEKLTLARDLNRRSSLQIEAAIEGQTLTIGQPVAPGEGEKL